MDKRVPENDYCDLEPGKICDNCCAGADGDLPVTSDALKDFLSSLPSNAQKEALLHLSRGLCNEDS